MKNLVMIVFLGLVTSTAVSSEKKVARSWNEGERIGKWLSKEYNDINNVPLAKADRYSGLRSDTHVMTKRNCSVFSNGKEIADMNDYFNKKSKRGFLLSKVIYDGHYDAILEIRIDINSWDYVNHKGRNISKGNNDISMRIYEEKGDDYTKVKFTGKSLKDVQLSLSNVSGYGNKSYQIKCK